MIFLEDKIWFSPLNVIHHFRELENKLSDKEKLSKGFRKAEEMYSVALMLVGIIKSQSREYWLQMVADKSASPDVRTVTYQQKEGVKMPEFTIQDVEVVDFDENSPEKSLTDFLKRTKLSNIKKSYDSLTTILCRVKSSIHLPSFKQMNQELKSTTFSGPVMILGRISVDEEKPVYKIAQIHPTVDLITEFNVLDELLNKKYNGVLSLKRATTFSTEYRAEEKHFPFEKISFADWCFYSASPPEFRQKRKPKPARIPPPTPPPRGRVRIPHPATIPPEKWGGVRSGLLHLILRKIK